MRKFFLVAFILSSTLWAMVPCTTNVSYEMDILEVDTEQMLTTEEGILKKAIIRYKEALDKKREMMEKLWKATTEIEFLMKHNQELRKEMIKHWENVKQSHLVM